MAAKHREILQAERGSLLDGYRGRWCRRLEADGKEDDLQFRMLLGQRDRIGT